MQTFENLPPLTQVAVLLLVVGTLYAHFRFNAKSAIDGPAILTTAGIFFTFFGIVVGLLHFNAQNIEASVPALLNGLKTAFVASAFGVFAALSIKLRYAIWGISAQYKRTERGGATIDDLVSQLTAVQHALVGTDESTLLSQMKLARSDTNDRLDALRKSQSEFMERMAENNSKALSCCRF